MEIILGQARRCWSEDEKRALVAETFVDGETVNGVAHRHNISRSMLFGWRKQYREALSFGSSTSTPIGFTAVAIGRPEQSEPPTPTPSPAAIPRAGVWARRSSAYFRGRRILTWRRRR